MEGGGVCPQCETKIADAKALICPACGFTLRLPNTAKLGITVMALGVLALLVWAVTVRSIFAFLAWLASLFYNPLSNRPFAPGPAPNVRQLLGDPLGRWAGDIIDWLGLNPALPPNDTLLWLGVLVLFLGLAVAFYGATIIRRAQSRAVAA